MQPHFGAVSGLAERSRCWCVFCRLVCAVLLQPPFLPERLVSLFVLFFICFHCCSVWFSSGYHCKIVSKWSGMPTKCITLYLQHCGCHSFLINFVKHFLKKGCVVINSKSVKGNFFGVFIFIYIMSCMFVIFYRIYCNEYLFRFLQL